ncbi:putative defensin-like protein 137 [Tripterygium wilfordii]|uniref:putative defensin-like protein 137 n=1 Tax=Tripterygium wilfordii TaxID=458696 RepID=UPI0018F83FE7|nr:putative defensin-like protein 137 [Tripterygium wilfordii]
MAIFSFNVVFILLVVNLSAAMVAETNAQEMCHQTIPGDTCNAVECLDVCVAAVDPTSHGNCIQSSPHHYSCLCTWECSA